MDIRKESSTTYVLSRVFGRDALRFSVEKRDGTVNYFIDYKEGSFMVNHDELHDFMKMITKAYEIAVEEEGNENN